MKKNEELEVAETIVYLIYTAVLLFAIYQIVRIAVSLESIAQSLAKL